MVNLDVVARDDNKRSESFSLKVAYSVNDLKVYKYIKHGDFYGGDGYQTARSARNFQHDPMKLWETQLNFTVYCATSGLGILTERLDAKQPLVIALYRFHVYYHIRHYP